MSVTAGTRLGSYEVIALIGEGGMGQVYRARDTKLGRDVALKVLPTLVAADPDRLARFRREAQVLAALNDPHIAQIYGFEDAGGTHALVMELVEGPTLAERIAEGPLPVSDALAIAGQIASALEAAHEHGIVHRDLKPANVKVREDGTVKVLDFGLAKAFSPEGASSTVDAANSPTITTPAMTAMGMILGTAAYMSPEQARGRPVDERADVWAFGVVLFEMLSGRRPFDGEDVSDTLANVLKRDPAWDALPGDVPPRVRQVLRACLRKAAKERLADMQDVRLALGGAFETTASAAPESAASPPPSRPLWWRALLPVAVALVAAVLTAAGAWFALRVPPTPAPVVRLEIPLQDSEQAGPVMLALSPDGQSLAFVLSGGRDGSSAPIRVRTMDALEPRVIEGTVGATFPFWSPDGREIGFFAQGKLEKIAVAGGPAQTLCDAVDGRGGTWSRDGVILFSAGPTSPILRVASGGGTPQAVTPPVAAGSGGGDRFPLFLPDGTHFLYNSLRGGDQSDVAGLHLGSLDGGPDVRLLPDNTNAAYVPERGERGRGYLLFRSGGALLAQRLDLATRRLSGEKIPVADRVLMTGVLGFGAFAAASNGTLVYVTTPDAASTSQLLWVDRRGTRLPALQSGRFFLGAISPDQRTVALNVGRPPRTDIWLYDEARNVMSRFTFGAGFNVSPVWSPDSTRVAFSSERSGSVSSSIVVKPSNGGGATTLFESGVNVAPDDWSADGRWLLFEQQGQNTGVDLWLLPVDGSQKPTPYLQTPFNQRDGRFAPGSSGSPRWVAYSSDESGQNEVYLQSIPAGTKFQVSTAGGTEPMWRRDGKELFFVASGALMAVPISVGAAVPIGAPRELFKIAGNRGYAPAADGQRFLVASLSGDAGAPPARAITVVLNWRPDAPR
jgi:Tol biopolymer transport system component